MGGKRLGEETKSSLTTDGWAILWTIKLLQRSCRYVNIYRRFSSQRARSLRISWQGYKRESMETPWNSCQSEIPLYLLVTTGLFTAQLFLTVSKRESRCHLILNPYTYPEACFTAGDLKRF